MLEKNRNSSDKQQSIKNILISKFVKGVFFISHSELDSESHKAYFTRIYSSPFKKQNKMNTGNQYLIKALDNYPYNLEEAVESLNYALSYEPKNPHGLCLMGRIEADTYSNYDAAIGYYQEALEEDVNAFFVYPHYLFALIWNEDYAKAHTLIEFALTVKGSDKAVIYARKVYALECERKYKEALEVIKIAKECTYNEGYMSYLNDEKKRIKSKMPKKKKPKNKKKQVETPAPEPKKRKWFWKRK